ncbi:heat shock protein 30 [Thelonectria olida]|uniref:Heat shock protein 30 n=1 Tax=Thelonectria olida TaxID=1576542 RepID=A0A9P8VMY2_9HYPO|nr:heat shock protein 30 [Thelonectria olida]
MALFSSNLYNPGVSFAPLLRLLDDFDNYSRQDQKGRRAGLLHWQPKFDACETSEAYKLQGELPGMKKDEVYIEFTDPQTMVIRGKTERTYASGTAPADLVQGTTMRGAITEGGKEQQPSQQATAEDQEDSPKPTEQSMDAGKQPAYQAKYWLTERSVGEFSRSFSFPTHVDQDAVTANFKDGIVNIVVPKSKNHEHRRIQIG